MTRVLALGDNQRDPRSRAAEHDRVMGFIADQVDELRPDVVAHGGDWTERPSLHEDREVLFAWCQRVTTRAPLVTVEGNHEEPGFVEEMRRLATEFPITAATRASVALVGGVAWALMPWPSRASILAHAEALYGAVPGGEAVTETANTLLERILRTLGVMLDQFGRDAPRVLLIHAEPATYSTDPDQPDHVAQGMRVGVEDAVHWTGVDAVLWSHIHCPQSFDVTRLDGVSVPVILIGSPRRTAYAKGELIEKGFVVVDFEGRTPTWRRVATPATPMHLVEVEWTQFRADGQWVFAGDDMRGFDPKGAEIRLRFATPSDQREAAGRAAEEMRAEWLAAGALDVKLDAVVETSTRARAPEVAQAPTLPEKIVATWRAWGESAPAEERRPRLLELAAEIAAEGAAA